MHQPNKFNTGSDTFYSTRNSSVSRSSESSNQNQKIDNFIKVGISVGLVSILATPVIVPINTNQGTISSAKTYSVIQKINLLDESFKTPYIGEISARQKVTKISHLSSKVSGAEQFDIWS